MTSCFSLQSQTRIHLFAFGRIIGYSGPRSITNSSPFCVGAEKSSKSKINVWCCTVLVKGLICAEGIFAIYVYSRRLSNSKNRAEVIYGALSGFSQEAIMIQ